MYISFHRMVHGTPAYLEFITCMDCCPCMDLKSQWWASPHTRDIC